MLLEAHAGFLRMARRGRAISPQSLAIAAAAVGLADEEGDPFRKVVAWSPLIVLIMWVLVYLQSTPALDWMVV